MKTDFGRRPQVMSKLMEEEAAAAEQEAAAKAKAAAADGDEGEDIYA